MSHHVEPVKEFAPAALARLLRANAAALSALVEGLAPAQLSWRPAADAWCINEVVGHLIEADERGYAGRIRRILSEENPHFVTWDQPAVARARGDDRRDGLALLAEFRALRDDGARLVEELDVAALDRSGEHPVVGRLTIRDLIHEWVYHDLDHLAQVYAIVKAQLWPHMGHARRFFGGG